MAKVRFRDDGKTIVRCKKDLFHTGERVFTKGKQYSGNTAHTVENMTVTNDNGEPHRIGHWAIHFSKIT